MAATRVNHPKTPTAFCTSGGRGRCRALSRHRRCRSGGRPREHHLAEQRGRHGANGRKNNAITIVPNHLPGPRASPPLPTSNTNGKQWRAGLVHVPDALSLNAVRHDLVPDLLLRFRLCVHINQPTPSLLQQLCRDKSQDSFWTPSGAAGPLATSYGIFPGATEPRPPEEPAHRWIQECRFRTVSAQRLRPRCTGQWTLLPASS